MDAQLRKKTIDIVARINNMHLEYVDLVDHIDFLLFSLNIDNISIAKSLNLNRISVGRKRKNKFWTPQELKIIADYCNNLLTNYNE